MLHRGSTRTSFGSGRSGWDAPHCRPQRRGDLSRPVTQAEIDAGDRPGTTTSDAERLAELEKENRELRRANAILRSASAFFAAELDRPQR